MLTKSLHISGMIHRFVLSTLLAFGSAPLLAVDNHQHSHAPDFSDPAIFAKVPDGWESMPIKHIDKHHDADLVVSLGQQSYPLFSDLIPEYARSNNLNIVVKQGTCGITSGRLLKKKVDVGAYCCPPGKTGKHQIRLPTPAPNAARS